MQFDWYQATIDDFPSKIVDSIGNHFTGAVLTHGRGMNNYASATTLFDADGSRIAVVNYGGYNPSPNVASSGPVSDAVARCLRAAWPVHRVTRADVAHDMEAPGLFNRLHPLCQSVAARYRVHGHTHLPDDPDDGATYYIGRASAQTMSRTYEKGKQLRHDPLAPSLPDWVRLELQARPQKANRVLCASMPPERFWGLSHWSRALSAAVLDLDVPKCGYSRYTKSDDDRAFAFMCLQYGAVLERRRLRLGSAAAVGMNIFDVIDHAHLRGEGA